MDTAGLPQPGAHGGPPQKSHVLAWTLSVTALLVLYVLSYSPLLGTLMRRNVAPHTLGMLFPFYEPVRWLHAHTILAGPLDTWDIWWDGYVYIFDMPIVETPLFDVPVVR